MFVCLKLKDLKQTERRKRSKVMLQHKLNFTITIYYGPKVADVTGRVQHAECLARIASPFN